MEANEGLDLLKKAWILPCIIKCYRVTTHITIPHYTRGLG